MLDEWMDEALAPATAPSRAGEWPLNGLRWTLLRAALQAPSSARMIARFSVVPGVLPAAGLKGPVALAPNHDADRFDCGLELLNRLIRKSLAEVRQGGEESLSTHVITSGDEIAGYYSTRPIFAHCDAAPEERIRLLFVPRIAVDLRWRRPGVAESMLLKMLSEAWDVPEAERPAAIVGLTISPQIKRFYRRIGVRPLAEAIHARGVIVPAVDLAAASAFNRAFGSDGKKRGTPSERAPRHE